MTTTSAIHLRPALLTPAAFAAFGDVIETEGRAHRTINDGFAERYHDLSRIDAMEAGGRPLLNIFAAKPRRLPLSIGMIERHPLSSQHFVPLARLPFLVVVAAPGDSPRADDLRAFVTNGRQGVTYARGTWHHPLIALGEPCDFLVIDRGGPGENCDEIHFADGEIVVEAPAA
jgi:ureidoglycolate lyase